MYALGLDKDGLFRNLVFLLGLAELTVGLRQSHTPAALLSHTDSTTM